MRDSRKGNMLLTSVLWLLFGCVGMTAMLYMASHKTIVIADVVQEQAESTQGQDVRHHPAGKQLLLQNGGTDERSICIPLAKGTKAENVVMENRYMEQELWVYLHGADLDFYLENAIYGDLTPVQDGYGETKQDGIVLKLQMTDVLEYRSTMDNSMLKIAFHEPKELYQLIVVVDPVGGGGNCGIMAGEVMEKTLALEVAKRLQKKIDREDIKLYFTRMEDETVSDESRKRLAEAVDADIYIAIGVSSDSENSAKYGIQSYYNEAYFIPQFGNVEMADILTRNVTIAASNRAVGLIPAEDESVLQDIRIPAAQVCLGYLSNSQEKVLLGQADYQEKLAEGLANAISEVYTVE